ncbi:zinc-binding dehydrogenase [Bradyrhizobium sp. CCGB12]|uniref:zinc-binding dehydrogenase n=1 Tax=Bradyrhizobium sp. CCGB12 TaxID=2949632 RepID=UPI0020B42CE4|nr:zinc-binding dehydrogenase [Bradyrhizobium sp. CCGB12]MCP3387693.1 zinc-binding dehydrogenase [Bradyrhizobium sp. CCGB12]
MRGERKIEAVKRYGADHAIDHRQGGFRDRELEITGGRGADVVFDPVGGDVFDESPGDIIRVHFCCRSRRAS